MDLSTPCSHWTGRLNLKGYGINGTQLAHRLAYEERFGPMPVGHVVDHGCHNADLTCTLGVECPHRRCVNPDHMECITLAENNRRGRVNATKTHCKHGHLFDEANTYVAARGSRECRACNAARFRERYRTRQAATA